jgi:hypothetical protein
MSQAAAQAQATTPNQGTADVQAPIELAGGSGPASFDELEAVTKFKSQRKKIEAEEDKQAEEAVQKEEKPKKDAKEAKEVKEEPKEAKAPKEKTKESEKESVKSVEKTDQTPKLIKVKTQDGETQVRSDAIVQVKVDGKPVEVPVQELLNRYSQKSHLDKLYSDYKVEKQTLVKEREQFNKALNVAYDVLVNKKDIRGFIEYLTDDLGMDGEAIWKESYDKVRQEAEELASLSPEERKARELETELEHYRQKEQARKTEVASKKEMQKLEQTVTQAIEQFGMTKDAFVKSYDELVKLGTKEADITPEMVGKFHKNMQTIQTVESALTSVNPELAQDQQVVTELATLAINNQASAEEITEVVNQLYGNEVEKKLARKVNKSIQQNAPKNRNPDKDPLFFDDL